MSSPAGRQKRGELLWREFAERERGQAVDNPTLLDDPRWDDIDEKVLAEMSAIEPKNWTKEQWQIYKDVRKDRKSKLKTSEMVDDLNAMSSDALLNSLTGNQ